MNPYTSLWTGVHEGDGPREFHLVLLDNGRTDVLADAVGREALHCIRCSACLNVCPVYERTGGHAYGSVYPGPIGAILTPQLVGLEQGRLATVRLDALRRVRRRLPGQDRHPARADPPARRARPRSATAERASGSSMQVARADVREPRAATSASSGWRGAGGRCPGSAPAARARCARGRTCRELPVVPDESFRDWWRRERG